MKKISFGSFPLTEIKAEDRRCLDRYLIKTFSDNISISDAIRNLAVTKDLMYITPDSLMKAWMEDKGKFENKNVSISDRTSNNIYTQALKRAFFILKEFYKKIQHAPFYKDYIYYPIYVEKVAKADAFGNIEKDKQYTEVQMNYSFVILSNDLTKGLKIDEIRYDENASLNFLFLFVEFFSSKEFGKSIHDFDQKDYEFLVKLYQFVEQSGKDPISMVMDLYKLLGMIKEAREGQKNPIFNRGLTSKVDDLQASNLKKYSGMIKHQLVGMIPKDGQVPADSYQKAFADLLNAIFKSEGLNGLYDGVEPDASRGERLRYTYSSNKYREVLNVAKELVEYNKLKCNKIISDDTLDFDFKVEHGEYSIDTQSQIISQKYQTFFKEYVQSIRDHLSSIVTLIMDELDVVKSVKTSIARNNNAHGRELDQINTNLKNLYILRNNKVKEMAAHEAGEKAAAAAGDVNAQAAATAHFKAAERDKLDAERQIMQLESEKEQRETVQAIEAGVHKSAEKILENQGNAIYKAMGERILSSIANDLTFIYDDGKRFFTNELVAKGFMEFADETSNYNIATPSGFEAIAAKADTEFPQTIDNKKEAGTHQNPKYFAAQIVKSLNDGFEMMAQDTITALGDYIAPALRDALASASQGIANDARQRNTPAMAMTENDIVTKALDKLIKDLLDSDSNIKQGSLGKIEQELKTTIYRNRFINRVFMNFKRMFRVRHVEKVIEFDKRISQLHPLIKKLASPKNDCQFFKSFILKLETAEQLYNTKFIVDNEKFLSGLTNKAPRKLNNPMNRLQTVLHDYLGLKDNPVWIISNTDVFLSMPDDLSLTNTSILSKIPKKDLMEVCKIKASDFWNENTMGKVSEFGNKRISQYYKEINKLNNEKDDVKKRDPKSKEEKKRKKDEINKIDKKIDRIEEKIAKLKDEEKNYIPNAFLFDDPNQAENAELLTPSEMQDLNQNKEQVREKLLKLNPYDDKEIDEMQASIEKTGSHPFDFMEDPDKPSTDRGQDPKEEKEEREDESDMDKFMRKRKEYHERQNRDY